MSRSGRGVGLVRSRVQVIEEEAAEVSRQLGRRLADLRFERCLSRAEVEERSDGEFKASGLGSYERGSRTMSLWRLHRLAAFYDVSLVSLLVGEDASTGVEPS